MWQLHCFPLCPFSRKVRLALSEKSVPFELVRENPWEANDAFYALNPAGRTPVLRDPNKRLTLVDSQANICRAMETTFTKMKLEPPQRSAIRGAVGLSLVPLLARLLPEADPELHDAMAEEYRRTFFAMRTSNALDPEPLFDAIAEALDALERVGWLLGVATGKSDRGLRLLLQHHGLYDRFVTLQTADRHPYKPHPSMVLQAIAEAGASPGTSFVVGDTSFDMAMASAAGAAAIGAGWGYHDAEELLEAGAIVVADRPSDVLSLVRERIDA